MKEGDRVVDKLVGFGVRGDAPDWGREVLAVANRSLQLEALFRTLLHPLWQIGKCPQQMYFPNSLTSDPAHPPHLQGFLEFQMQSLVLVIFVL